jgi:hypothetical protein
VNKILSNLEAKVQSVTVRLLTRELRPEFDEDIPTILLRVNNIEYQKTHNPTSPVPNKSQQEKSKPMVSDL